MIEALSFDTEEVLFNIASFTYTGTNKSSEVFLSVSINNNPAENISVTQPKINPNYILNACIEATDPRTYALNDIFIKFTPNVSIKQHEYFIMLFP